MWTPPTQLPDKLFGPIAIDTETKDQSLKIRGPGYCYKHNRDEGPVGISIKSDNWKGYLPFGHEEGGNMDKDLALRWFQAQMLDENQPKIYANAMYEEGWFRRMNLKVLGPKHDVLVMAPLINENMGRAFYNLDDVGLEYAGVGKDETKLIEEAKKRGLKKKDDYKAIMWRFHSSIVGEYAEQDAEVTHLLYKVFQPMMDDWDLWDIYRLEMDLLPVLLDMRFRGVRVNLDLAEQYKNEFESKTREIIQEVKRLTGIEVSITDPKSKAAVMKSLGFTPPITPKTKKESITKDWLEEVAANSNEPVAKMLVMAGKYHKAAKDFIVANIFEKQEDGRVFANFHQLASDEGGTVGGRFSCSKPNLQNQFNPEKEPEIGTKIRRLWEPEEGDEWGSADYSSQEPRLTLHYAYITGQRGAVEAVNRFHANPKTDYHQMVADFAGITRKQAKPINLGLAYGMGEAKLCHKLGLPTVWEEQDWGKQGKRMVEVAGPEGKELLRKYHEGIPYLQGLVKECKKKANERGWIRTILGRVCRFPKGSDGRYWYTHKALNRLIQGSAADQSKRAMIECHRAGIKILAMVHDELCISGHDADFKLLEEIMVNCVPLAVPVVVDLARGPNWGDATENWKEAA